MLVTATQHQMSWSGIAAVQVPVVTWYEVSIVDYEAGELLLFQRLHEAHVEHQAPVEQIVLGLKENGKTSPTRNGEDR